MDPQPTPPPPPKRSTWRGVAIAGTCTAAMLVNSSNNTSVAIALPTIGAALHARAAALQWLVSAYPLSSGCLLLFCGHIADVHGRKRVFVGGSAILAAFTLACGFAHDEVTLAVLRGLQGVGGAATIPAALGILAHEFPPSSGRARAAAFSSFSAGAPIGGALGMVLGGLVTQLSKYTWRAQFFLSAAIAFTTLLVGVFVIPPDAPLLAAAAPSNVSPPPTATSASVADRIPSASAAHTYPPETTDLALQAPNPVASRDTRTDWPGAFLSAAGLILLVFVLGQGSGPGVPPPTMFVGRPPPPRGLSVFPRELPPLPLPQEVAFNLDTSDEDENAFAHSHPPWGDMHNHRPPSPPPPPGGFLRWLFGPPHPHTHHGPPHRRGPPDGPPEATFWRVQSDSDSFDFDAELELKIEDLDPHPPHHGPHPHPHHPHGPPHDELELEVDWEEVHSPDHGRHPHHQHEPSHGPSHGGLHMHSHDGKHPHHGLHHHGPGLHPGPPPQPGLGAIIDWLAGRPPRPPHWHGPRHPAPPPPPPGGGPSWGRMPPDPMWRGDEAWGMAYIISLLLLSLILLALFAVWEFHLERVHSQPGGVFYDPAGHQPRHQQDSSDDIAADPRRSSASSAWQPPPTLSNPSKPPAPTGIFARVSNWRLVRPIKNSRYFKAAAAYAPPPLVPPSLFARRRGRVGVVYGIALLQFAAFMVWAFWVQLYYQVYIGYSPVRTVVRLTPMFVTGLICNVVVALIAGRVPTLWLLASGTLTTTVAPLLFALIVPSAPYWAFGFPAAVCSVVGADFLFASGTMFVSESVSPHEQSVAGGVFQTMIQLGTTFGITASTIVFNHVQQIANHRDADALRSYHAAMWTGVAFGGVATLLALIAFRGVGISGSTQEPVPDGAEKNGGAGAGAEP